MAQHLLILLLGFVACKRKKGYIHDKWVLWETIKGMETVMRVIELRELRGKKIRVLSSHRNMDVYNNVSFHLIIGFRKLFFLQTAVEFLS